ncbi:RteC domain-containing protein [Pedobacter sp. P26]|uniref:RteC domain-containing protein n=1 Tax=Pedobacter sp. P26 TaxID=3423956 RepID=UPI003D67288C
MNRTYIDGLYAAMEDELADIHQFPEHFSRSLGIVSSSMQLIHNHIISDGFACDSDEIEFFKVIKPRFYHWYIFLVERHNIMKGLAIGIEHMARDYYLQELSFIKRFFDQHAFVYHYFLEGETSRDCDFFLRSTFQAALDAPGFMLGNFSTNHDYTFAKIMAYERLQEFLIVRLRATYTAEVGTILGELRSAKKRTWTDEKIKLVELAYGIYFMGSVDFGKADISDIIAGLENCFNVHLGVVYRRFVEISRRKSESHTAYLDAMRTEIVRRIHEKDRYKPFVPKKRPGSDTDKNI